MNDFFAPALGRTPLTSNWLTAPSGKSASLATNELQSQLLPPSRRSRTRAIERRLHCHKQQRRHHAVASQNKPLPRRRRTTASAKRRRRLRNRLLQVVRRVRHLHRAAAGAVQRQDLTRAGRRKQPVHLHGAVLRRVLRARPRAWLHHHLRHSGAGYPHHGRERALLRLRGSIPPRWLVSWRARSGKIRPTKTGAAAATATATATSISSACVWPWGG